MKKRITVGVAALMAVVLVLVCVGLRAMLLAPMPLSREAATQRFILTMALLNRFTSTSPYDYSPVRDAAGVSWRYNLFAYETGEAFRLREPPEDEKSRTLFVKEWAFYWSLYDRGRPDPQNCKPRIVAITGPGTAFDGGEYRIEFTPHDLIVLIEFNNCDCRWDQACDLSVTDLERWKALGSPAKTFQTFYDGFHVAFANGECWFLSPETPWEAIEPYMTADGARAASGRTALLKYVVETSFAESPLD